MGLYLDLTNQRFGRLVALKRDITSKKTKWLCQCDCGNVKSIALTHLRSGSSTSCGCYQKEKAREANIKHGGRGTSLYNRWKAIRQRTTNPHDVGYKNYGGRGIKMCDEWDNFQNFYDWCIQNGYKRELELDRIDNNKGYDPSNCRWVTKIVNNNNKRKVVHVEGLTFTEISNKTNIPRSVIRSRYYDYKKANKEITIETLTRQYQAKSIQKW